MKTFANNLGSFFKDAWAGLRSLPKLNKDSVLHLFESFSRRDIAILLVLMVVFAASGGFLIFSNNDEIRLGDPAFGGEYIEGVVGQPRYLNPVLASASSVDTDLSRLLYAQLLKFDKDLQLVPDIAISLPEISEDQKTYTIKLRPDARWHDGKPLLADDVLFTIGLIQNSDYDSPLRSNWSRVRVEKIDDLTVSFELREVSASFILNFMVGILPKHVWENTTPTSFRLSDSNIQPIGSGPFEIREIKKTADGIIRSIGLKASETYFDGRPYLDRFVVKFYDSYEQMLAGYHGREIDGFGYVPFDKKAFIEPSSRYNQMSINLPQYQAVFFNLQRSEIAQDKAVRQALWLATDRRQIIDEVYFGFANEAFGPILEGNLGYNEQIKEQTHMSLEEAEQILDRAGWTKNPDTGIRTKGDEQLEFDLTTNSFALNVKTAQLLQAQWQKLGMIVQLVIVSNNDLDQQYIKPRQFDLLLFSENVGADPDPFAFWHSSQARDPGQNVSGFSNAEADRLLTAARQTTNVTTRAQNYMQFQNILAGEIPAIFLDSAVYVYQMPKKVQGVELQTIIHPSERFLDVKNWYIETK